MKDSMVFRAYIIVTLVAFQVFAADSIAAAGDENVLKEIISNVRSNERLYANIDVILSYKYDVGQNKAVRAKAGEFQAFETQDYKLHFVGQNEFFRLDREGSVGFAGESASFDRIRAYDGATTRLLEQRRYANIIKGRDEVDSEVRPHMIFLRSAPFSVPLSTYLSGHEAMRSDPNANWQPGYTTNVEYKGETKHNELQCHVVWITTSAGGPPNDRWEMLLAEDRNYLPVKASNYMLRFSETIPMGEGEVDQWEEVKPTIWFPKKWGTRIYKWTEISKGLKVVQSRDTYTTEKNLVGCQIRFELFPRCAYP